MDSSSGVRANHFVIDYYVTLDLLAEVGLEIGVQTKQCSQIRYFAI